MPNLSDDDGFSWRAALSAVDADNLDTGPNPVVHVNYGHEFVIDRYTVAARTFDALVFGYYDADKLIYAARNGTTASRQRCGTS